MHQELGILRPGMYFYPIVRGLGSIGETTEHKRAYYSTTRTIGLVCPLSSLGMPELTGRIAVALMVDERIS